jgi:hypothetical protein
MGREQNSRKTGEGKKKSRDERGKKIGGIQYIGEIRGKGKKGERAWNGERRWISEA